MVGKSIWIIFAALALLALWFVYRPIHSDIRWLSDIEQARRRATQQDKPILLYFAADWCAACGTMSRRTWPDEGVELLIMGSFVPVKVDLSDRQKPQPLADTYAVFALPTILVTDAAGRLLKTLEGYFSPEELLSQLSAAAPNAP